MEPVDIMINFQAFGLAHLLQMLVLETGNIAERQQILRMSSQPPLERRRSMDSI